MSVSPAVSEGDSRWPGSRIDRGIRYRAVRISHGRTRPLAQHLVKLNRAAKQIEPKNEAAVLYFADHH